MKRIVVMLSLLLVSQVSVAENPSELTDVDARILVDMPIPAQQILRQRMQANLSAVNQLVKAFTEKDWQTIAVVAENNLSISAKGKGHANGGMGPGRYMPKSMRQIGISLHAAGSELAIAATAEDEQAVAEAFQKVTAACVACHLSYRIR